MGCVAGKLMQTNDIHRLGVVLGRSSSQRYEDESDVSSTSSGSSVSTQDLTTLDDDEDEQEVFEETVLYKLAKQWSWPAIIYRCETHPHEACSLYQNENHESLLHWICFGRPPVEVVQAVLKANPKAASIRNSMTGDYPLHVACAYRASESVIQLLIDTFPKALSVLGHEFQYTPLHLVCDYGCSVDVFQTLITACVQLYHDPIFPLQEPSSTLTSLSRMDKPQRRSYSPIQLKYTGGERPIEILCSRNEQTLACILWAENVNEAGKKARILWSKVSMLIKAEYNLTMMNAMRKQEASHDLNHDFHYYNTQSFDFFSHHKTTLLHSILSIRPYYPRLLIQIIIHLFPEYLSQADIFGRLPLHIHVSTPTYMDEINNFDTEFTMDHVFNNNNNFLQSSVPISSDPKCTTEQVLYNLVTRYPQAAQTRDMNRNLPFSLATYYSKHKKFFFANKKLHSDNGIDNDDNDYVNSSIKDLDAYWIGNFAWEHGMKHLLYCHPEALESCSNESSCKFPYLSLKTFKNCINSITIRKYNNDQEERDEMDSSRSHDDPVVWEDNELKVTCYPFLLEQIGKGKTVTDFNAMFQVLKNKPELFRR